MAPNKSGTRSIAVRCGDSCARRTNISCSSGAASGSSRLPAALCGATPTPEFTCRRMARSPAEGTLLAIASASVAPSTWYNSDRRTRSDRRESTTRSAEACEQLLRSYTSVARTSASGATNKVTWKFVRSTDFHLETTNVSSRRLLLDEAPHSPWTAASIESSNTTTSDWNNCALVGTAVSRCRCTNDAHMRPGWHSASASAWARRSVARTLSDESSCDTTRHQLASCSTQRTYGYT